RPWRGRISFAKNGFRRMEVAFNNGPREGWEAVPRTADSPTRCSRESYLLPESSAAGHALNKIPKETPGPFNLICVYINLNYCVYSIFVLK
ncbi:MAG: hypothetical protein K2X80_04240, partial [Pseudomonadaceae bacterium]|nr:hypothetical protein [Pseudomonadaceae bacterium]